jgi:hypothetical protein
MRLPTQRLTITPTEYRLLRPGLEVLANGLATAKLGATPIGIHTTTSIS